MEHGRSSFVYIVMPLQTGRICIGVALMDSRSFGDRVPEEHSLQIAQF
jgi:hypothetical protein